MDIREAEKQTLLLDGQALESVDKFTYLGIVTRNSSRKFQLSRK